MKRSRNTTGSTPACPHRQCYQTAFAVYETMRRYGVQPDEIAVGLAHGQLVVVFADTACPAGLLDVDEKTFAAEWHAAAAWWNDPANEAAASAIWVAFKSTTDLLRFAAMVGTVRREQAAMAQA